MVSFNILKAQGIVADVSTTDAIKIEKLREIEGEARALQRAASESSMNDNDGWTTICAKSDWHSTNWVRRNHPKGRQASRDVLPQ